MIKQNESQINGEVTINVCKKYICEKDYFWNSATCNYENGKYLASIVDDSAIICDGVIGSYAKLSLKDDYEQINFNEKEAICKTRNFYNLLVYLLITIVLLIAVTIYCYLIKYQRKHIWPFHNTNNKLSKLKNEF